MSRAGSAVYIPLTLQFSYPIFEEKSVMRKLDGSKENFGSMGAEIKTEAISRDDLDPRFLRDRRST